MTGREKAKARPDTLETEQDLRRDVELREERRISGERIQQQVMNQGGLDTGTHSSSHRGVDWPASYQVRPEVDKQITSRKQVEDRAYELYLLRGCQNGHDVEDWLLAEKELKHSKDN